MLVFLSRQLKTSYITTHVVFAMSKKTRPPTKLKEKERISAKAVSDEKAGKIAKQEEEEQQKLKEERLKKRNETLLLRSKQPHIKTFDSFYEGFIPKDQLNKIRNEQYLRITGHYYQDLQKEPLKPKQIVSYDKHLISEPLEGIQRYKNKAPIMHKNIVDNINKDFYPMLKPNIYDDQPLAKPKRSGVLAIKVGMTGLWDQWGYRHTLTVLQLDQCFVTQVKTKEKDGVDAVQVGCGQVNLKRLTKPMMGHFLKSGLPPLKYLAEFPISSENKLPVGFMFSARHFTPGQLVDITGISVGKGFAGTIKRHGFHRQPASHGCSISHRRLGSTGMRQDPGRVFKGKKMPGHMGCERTIVEKLTVYKIDSERQLIYVKGSVPGKAGNVVRIRDAFKNNNFDLINFPTWIKEEGKKYSKEMTMLAPDEDPELREDHENDMVTAEDDDVD